MGLGSKLRSARVALGLTIADVASRAGLSQSYVSQLERDQANPSLSALTRVAQALEFDLPTFFADNPVASEPINSAPEDDDLPTRIVKRDRRRTLVYPGSHVRYELLCPDLQHALQVHKTISPVGTSSDNPIRHKGEEFVLVLRGILELTIQRQSYVMEAGDSAYFDGTKEHGWRNAGPDELEVLWVITPPHF